MKKKLLLTALLVSVFIGGMSANAAIKAINGTFEGNPIVKLLYNNKEVKPESIPAYVYKGRTMVPIGFLKQLGAEVTWDAKAYSATIKLPTRTVPVLIKSQLDELSKSAYKVITAPTKDHPNGKQGSGFFLGDTFVTNAHVAADAEWAAVQIDGVWKKVTKYDFVNADVDLMGFKLSGGKSLPVSTVLPSAGDPVYDIGFPNGVLTVTEGVVYSVGDLFGYTQIVHTAKTTNGSSGGILMNGRGEVIAVNKSALPDASFAIPIKYVLAELNK